MRLSLQRARASDPRHSAYPQDRQARLVDGLDSTGADSQPLGVDSSRPLPPRRPARAAPRVRALGSLA